MRSREQFLLLQGGAAWNFGPWQGRRRNPRRPELGLSFTGRKLLRLRPQCQGLHRAEPGVYSVAHAPIFPPGAKADAVALAWMVAEGGG